jgi:hypothetical protein
MAFNGAVSWQTAGAGNGPSTTGLTALDLTGSCTWAWWYRGTKQIDVVVHSDNTNGYLIRMRPALGDFQLRLTAASVSTSYGPPAGPRPVAPNQWRHYAIVYDATAAVILFYVDGRHLATVARTGGAPATPTAATTRILNDAGTPTAGTVGRMFDLQVFNGLALGQAEIWRLIDPTRTNWTATARFARSWANPGVSGTIRDESLNGWGLTATANPGGYDVCESPDWTRVAGRFTSRRGGIGAPAAGAPIVATGAAGAAGVAVLSVRRRATATGAASAAGTATLQVRRSLFGVGSASAVGTASLRVLRSLFATGAASAAGTATLRAGNPMTATGAGSAAGTASLRVLRSLAAASAASAAGTASLRVVRALAAAGAASAVGTAVAAVRRRLTATGAGSAAGTATFSATYLPANLSADLSVLPALSADPETTLALGGGLDDPQPALSAAPIIFQ